MSEELIRKVAREITYKENFRLLCERDQKDPEGRLYYQVECYRPDVYTGEMGTGHGGKLYLSEHAVEDELVRKAFQLFIAYEEHECREWFKWNGRAVFGPHISVEALWDVADQLNFPVMKPIYKGRHAERCELRIAKSDHQCWTWAERDGSPEPQCTRIIGRGEEYMVSTIYPGHDSGYADGGHKWEMKWVGRTYDWRQVPVPPRPVSSQFCLPCCERWTNLKEALDWIREQRRE